MFARKYLAKNSCNLSLLYNSWNKFGKGFREGQSESNPLSPSLYHRRNEISARETTSGEGEVDAYFP